MPSQCCSNSTSISATVPAEVQVRVLIANRPPSVLHPRPSPLMSRPGALPVTKGALSALVNWPAPNWPLLGARNSRYHRTFHRHFKTSQNVQRSRGTSDSTERDGWTGSEPLAGHVAHLQLLLRSVDHPAERSKK